MRKLETHLIYLFKLKHIVIVVAPLLFLEQTLQASDGTPCVQEELPKYLAGIQVEKDKYRLKTAADCAVKLDPSRETIGILLNRLQLTLQETRNLKTDELPIKQAEIALALARALYSIKVKSGYEKIAGYFDHADWNSRRDQIFFYVIATETYPLNELTETFYLALTQIPASGLDALGQACSMFSRSLDHSVVRDDPKFIHGVLSALSRLEQNFPHVENQAKTRCKKTLLSQLLDEKMRHAFLSLYLDLLPADERRILDQFMAKIASPPDAELVEELTNVFFATPWKIEFNTWQKNNPNIVCKPFQGNSFVTRMDDLWCYACTSRTERLLSRVYFYPDKEGKHCTLQQARYSYPSTSQGAFSLLVKRLTKRMGPGIPLKEVSERGSAFWERIVSWDWHGLKVFVFRNKGEAIHEEGLPLVEILARDGELITAMTQEESAYEAMEKEEKENEQKDGAKIERLYREVEKDFPELIQRLEKGAKSGSMYAVLRELLPKIAREGPERAAQLYLADRIANALPPSFFTPEELENLDTPNKKLEDLNTLNKALSAYGVVYYLLRDGIVAYNHIFLTKIIEEGLTGYWAEEAFLNWLTMWWYVDPGCKEADLFKKVIANGEKFLKKNPKSRIRKQLLWALAEANETGWSLSLASPEDVYVDPKKYKSDAPQHRKKAIYYYEQIIKEYPDSNEAVLARLRLRHLRLGVDTNSRKFYCIYD